MCSTPPAITTSYWPKPMPDAVVVTAVIAPAHMRVDGESWNGFGETGEDRSGAADGQALVAGLRGGCNGNFVDPCGIELRVCGEAAHESP